MTIYTDFPFTKACSSSLLTVLYRLKTLMVLWPLAAACQELVPPAIVQTLADLVFAADIRHGALASEPFQDCHHLGLRINLTAFHAHPLRHYTRLTLCLSL